MTTSPAISDATCGKIGEIWRRLRCTYGEPELKPTGDPVGELVLTILSQHTTDASSARAYASLRNQFPTWASVIEAPIEDVAAAIRFAGLARQKATTIQAALRTTNELELLMLAERSVPEARTSLTNIKGVGDKTASCVLLFALGMPAQPVDTHIERVSKRIGLGESARSATHIQRSFEQCLPAHAQVMFAFHVDMIRHGREICTARAPKCSMCVMTDICDFYSHSMKAMV